MTTLYQDFTNDLIAARQTARLIEVQKKHIEQLKKENEIFSEFETYRKIYDAELSNYNLTNIIVIDANAGEKAQILNAIYHLISSSLKAKKTIDSLLKLVVSFSTMGLADLVAENVTSQISDLIDTVVDKFSEDISEKSVSMALDKVEDVSNNIADLANKRHQLGSELYLSNEAQKCLLELATNISQEHTPHQAIQFTMKLITSLGLDAPKLIVINNPYHLDSASLSLCSLLFSYAKDLNQKSESTNISVVFNYTDRQPYDMSPIAQSADKDDSTRYTTLTRLRHMVQRYGMLEKPGSNIPKPAIKASTFVGRKEELEQLSQSYFDFVKECTEKTKGTKESLWTMIKGEPGTGKTALINKHIENITNPKDSLLSSQIRLRLLNQIGHNSEVTGLASLLQFIQSEAIRLTHYYQTKQNFVVQAINDKKIVIKNAKDDAEHAVGGGYSSRKSTIKNAVKFIADCAGFGTMHDATSSAFDALTLDKSQFQTMNVLDTDNKEDKKQEQFEQLNIALMHLSNISEAVNPGAKAVPLLLFIDDLQWIDELSAEYILNQLLPKFSVQLLITARKSDSETSFKLAKQDENLSPHKLKLFEIANLFSTPSNKKSQNKNSSTELNNIKLTEQLNLRGMDKTTLASLISTVYQNTTQYSADIIASALIEALTEEQISEQTQVVTLFAVEALNVVSDDAFYHRNADVARLIIQNEKGMFRINTETEQSLSHIVERVFKLLREAHQDAFNHDSFQNETTRNFTLSSYAVMEERLFIIHQYFAEYGDAATFSLQLGALIGAPFDSSLVSELITKLSTVDISKYPTMSPIKTFLNQQSGQTLTYEHLEILDEVFEILRRLQQGQNMHQYRHGLFALFLRQQAKHTLDKVLNYRQNSHTFNAFVALCQDVLNEKIDKFLELKQPTKAQFEVQLYLKNSLNRLLEFAYDIDAQYWGKPFCSSLRTLASTYNLTGQSENAISLGEDAVTIAEYCYTENPSLWSGEYCSTLHTLALFYGKIEQNDEAIRLNTKSNNIQEELYTATDENWRGYCKSLNNLASQYALVGQEDEALKLIEKALLIVEPKYSKDPDQRAGIYSLLLNTCAGIYNEMERHRESIRVGKKALLIRKKLYGINPDIWAEYYSDSLVNLADSYRQIDNLSKCNELQEVALDIRKKLYIKNPEIWADLYVNGLINRSGLHYTRGEMYDAIHLNVKALQIVEPNYSKNAGYWINIYISLLNNLASYYDKSDKVIDAINIGKRALIILTQRFSLNPYRWEKQYLTSLINVATFYMNASNYEDAIKIGEIALPISKRLYNENDTLSVINYSATLNNLAESYIQVEDRNIDAILFNKKALAIRKKGFSNNPSLWAEDYSISLNNLGFCYVQSGIETEQAKNLFQQSLNIREDGFRKDPDFWVNYYYGSLISLSFISMKLKYFEVAINLGKRARNILKPYFELAPEQWGESYYNSLTHLIQTWQQIENVNETIRYMGESLVVLEKLYTSRPEVWGLEFWSVMMTIPDSFIESTNMIEGTEVLRRALIIAETAYYKEPIVWAQRYMGLKKKLAKTNKK
ncbi:tetratricopeptide repeat protein [Aliiglaciecola sp. 3_MG-2023]|uniref:tetratricopeptide repeat protein n=1 Tax=Aliiglaciecola sp. 3_MG-2023 TaxID=3062644 RepID=UPI0026E1CB5A|nr:tetratricopeptide repeat protein [Aliiglaciecola sp. 3_MG-2023]MDO6693554.1 tetratricopeptide repeat protein [Aliiglaciecola sp. 3_MG-2023]